MVLRTSETELDNVKGNARHALGMFALCSKLETRFGNNLHIQMRNGDNEISRFLVSAENLPQEQSCMSNSFCM